MFDFFDHFMECSTI